MKSEQRSKRKPMLVGLGVGAVLSMLFIIAVTFPPDLSERPADAEVHGQRVAYHHHVSIWYYVDGMREPMPAGLGMGPDYENHELAQYGLEGLLPIHTHDLNGLVHIEPTEDRTFTFGDWLDVWGLELDNRVVTLTKADMDGSEEIIFDYRNYVMQDADRLILEVETPGRLS